MTTALYNKGKVNILRGDIALASDSIRLLPVTEGYTPDLDLDETLEDIPGGNRAGAAGVLTGKLFLVLEGLATFDALDTTIPAVPSGDPIVAFVLYKHTGTESTSLLIGYFDNFANLPITPDGRDIMASWPNDADRIFSW